MHALFTSTYIYNQNFNIKYLNMNSRNADELYGTIQHNTINTLHHNTINTIQHNTIRQNMIQHNTLQYFL